jgi:hypothetical protein
MLVTKGLLSEFTEKYSMRKTIGKLNDEIIIGKTKAKTTNSVVSRLFFEVTIKVSILSVEIGSTNVVTNINKLKYPNSLGEYCLVSNGSANKDIICAKNVPLPNLSTERLKFTFHIQKE